MQRGDDAKGGDRSASAETKRETGSPAAGAAPTPEPADVDSHADTVAGSDEIAAGEEPVPSSHRTTEEMGDSLVGAVLQDRYEITRKIGQGGMGAVYEARHTIIGKRVAIKVLLDKYAQKESIVARLEQEARLASSIGHENIIDITDFGTIDDGRTFVVMEYLDGESLGALLAREGRLPPERAISIARQIASALGAAHKKDVIHRDIKPENIFLQHREGRDFVKVVDFGISKLVRPQEEGAERLTQTGMVLGTPLYMSPEQARGDEELDHRIDVYALGVMLYEMFTGEVPFTGSNYLNIVSQVLSEKPKSPREHVPDLSEDIELVILKAMERDLDERYRDMGELDDDLAALELAAGGLTTTAARLSAGRLRKRRRMTRFKKQAAWAGGVAVVASAVVLAVTQLTGSSGEPAAAAAPAADAGRVIPRADAAPKRPSWELVTITIKSEPPGATLYEGNRRLGVTPYPYQAAKVLEQIELTAELEGYETGTLTVRPHLDGGGSVLVELQEKEPEADEEEKAAKGRDRKRRRRRKGRGEGKGKEKKRGDEKEGVDDSLGGELGGFR